MQSFEKLRIINLSHSKFLRGIPDLSTAPKLERLCLGNSTSLVEIHESVGHLTRLVTLNLEFCSNLRTCPKNLVSKPFTTLKFQGCLKLHYFPNVLVEMRHLRSLNLCFTAVEELPSSIELLVSLRVLALSFCKRLTYIPTNIYKLLNLRQLNLRGCSNLCKFPNNVSISSWPPTQSQVSYYSCPSNILQFFVSHVVVL